MSLFRIRVTGGGRPLPDVRISREVGARWELVGRTDFDGYQLWEIDPAILPLKLLFEPRSGFWPKHVGFQDAAGEAEVRLAPLPRAGPIGWWHRSLGPAAGRRDAGAGIRVGVLDTGVGPCSCLRHVVAAGAWVAGTLVPEPEATLDLGSHGTHVVGLIAARSCAPTDYVGVAPGVTAVVSRVFSSVSGEAAHDDVANAIDSLVQEHRVHLLNLSLGGARPAEVERDAVLDAIDSGALVLAASGNDNGPVQFPAAYDGVVAVGALGKLDEGSEIGRMGTYVARGEPFDDAAGLYPADFSCHGPEITCIAPGVEIISAVPSAEEGCEFAAMTGTSMATPIACGALAILLSEDRDYLEMAPTRERSAHAFRVLTQACRDLGFPEDRQGAGLPAVP